MLGHASIVLTADPYTSVLPCLAHQTAEATAALVEVHPAEPYRRTQCRDSGTLADILFIVNRRVITRHWSSDPDERSRPWTRTYWHDIGRYSRSG